MLWNKFSFLQFAKQLRPLSSGRKLMFAELFQFLTYL